MTYPLPIYSFKYCQIFPNILTVTFMSFMLCVFFNNLLTPFSATHMYTRSVDNLPVAKLLKKNYFPSPSSDQLSIEPQRGMGPNKPMSSPVLEFP